MKSLKQSAFVLIILGTVTFLSCNRASAPSGERVPQGDVQLGGTLRVAEKQAPAAICPDRIDDAISSRIGTQLHCGLLRLDSRTLQVIPGIAESWSVDDKGTSYVFQLRKGALFHADKCFGKSPREITARDFLYSFSLLCSPDAGPAFSTTFKGRVLGADSLNSGETDVLSGVEVIDDYNLRIELIKPDPSFLFVLAQPSAAVVSEIADKAYGPASTVGAGPFMLSSHDSDWLLVRNPEYFLHDAFGNQLPYIDSLSISFIGTKQIELSSFFEGDIDLVTHLYLDPVRELLDAHIADFSGSQPKYIMHRESVASGYETYSISTARVKGFVENFMDYRDYSQVQLKE